MYSQPIVFTDFHHNALLYSLILLFEGRLGGTIFTPIGTDWYTHGFWKVSDSPEIIKQYLNFDRAVPDGSSKFNENAESTSNPVYLCQNKNILGHTNKAVTLDGFYQLPVDIVIASIPTHIEPFLRLCENHPNKPKLIYQIGNAWTAEAGLAPNVMASALIHNIPKDIHFISNHQEFDLSVFYPDLSYPEQNIYSFIHCLNTIDAFASDWKLFQSVEKLMPDWNFKSYGGLCRDGCASGTDEVAKQMRGARFIWHTKKGGDGYGHVLYNSAAVARPMIVKMEYYRDKLGRELMIDGQTCLAIDGLSPQEVVNKILYYSDSQRYATLCKNVYENFKAKVDFDKEAETLQKFIKGLN
ncbi:glycosyltransferase [Paenibacillus prosopidis]|uniref:Glycosyl transferase family 1 n=1 Tax=Paenibacillus prosopidis TaxID=630520 RepID=A0A368W730_9BACL|nr:glycosyltransferase [Paenibacillus prosopidis]RCW50866.1 hypothetical protein DFP97_10258 [Paenibacillus prosopidis]